MQKISDPYSWKDWLNGGSMHLLSRAPYNAKQVVSSLGFSIIVQQTLYWSWQNSPIMPQLWSIITATFICFIVVQLYCISDLWYYFISSIMFYAFCVIDKLIMASSLVHIFCGSNVHMWPDLKKPGFHTQNIKLTISPEMD